LQLGCFSKFQIALLSLVGFGLTTSTLSAQEKTSSPDVPVERAAVIDPGIMMPANPYVGQTYTMEYAPGITIETAEIMSMGETYVTPAGTFNNVLTVLENGVSIKKYAPGVGMIYDDGIVLVSYSGVSDVEEGDNTPADFALAQNYPNPFNPSTTIEYSLGNASPVKLIVYDLLGQEVATIVDEVQNAGTHTLAFDGSHLESSVYFYRLETGDFVSSRRMILIK
jgi:hypothetical protein